ncbi:hypothetical protein HC928_25290 [bacterium]|nr:hypothetical protein [bacterium]
MATTTTRNPEVKRHLALGLDPKDLQFRSSPQQPPQPPAETYMGFLHRIAPTACPQHHEGSPPHTLRHSP